MKARLRQLVTAANRAAQAFGWGGVSNGMALAGAGLVTWGVAELHPSAGLIVAGLFLLAISWFMGRAG